MSSESFTCATCGKQHPGLPLDYGFGLPDEVYTLGYVEQYLRSRSNKDLCTLDESRYFLRGVIRVPFVDSSEEFCWGIWVEVSKAAHDTHAQGFEADLSQLPRYDAKLANELRGSGGTLGLAVEVQYSAGNERPAFHFPRSATHVLARDQREGIDSARHHEMLEAVGYFARMEGG